MGGTPLILAIVSGLAISWQPAAPAPKVTAETKLTLAPSASKVLNLNVQFADGYHGYQNPPSDEYQLPVKVTGAKSPVRVVKVAYPAGVDFKMEGEKKFSKVYSGKVAFPVTLKAPAKAGTYKLELKLEAQQCTDRECYPPVTVSHWVTVTVKK
jgi:DsbC/DsbD-like thiol-disulfide interchange protein